MKSHPHGKDTGTNAAIVRDLVADDGTFGRIHDKPDIGFYTTDLDVSFIGSKDFSSLVIIVVNERLDTERSRLAVISDLLMRDGDAMDIFKSHAGFP